MEENDYTGDKRITFYVTEEFRKAFKSEAVHAPGGTMQSVMMKLVRDWLGTRGALPQPQRKSRSK